MKETEIQNNFKQYCHSKEESNAPFIPLLIKLGMKLNGLPWIKKDSITLASRYGKRLLITTKNLDITNLKRQDFIEIIDVDPVKKIILYFGPSFPPDITPYLWVMHYAKKELQFSIYFKYEHEENIIESLPYIEKKGDFIDIVKKMLLLLQQTSGFQFNTNGIIITGQTMNEIEKIINTKR